jgi:phage-related protein
LEPEDGHEAGSVSRQFQRGHFEISEGERRNLGFQIGRVQSGRDPDDWKPMTIIGRGVREIRVRDETGAYRVIYVASFQAAAYILHAFQKKTQATPKRDIDIAEARYRELLGILSP